MIKLHPYVITALLMIAFQALAIEASLSTPSPQHNADVASRGRDDSGSYVTGVTSGRARSLVGTVLGLVSVIVGWRVSKRSSATQRSWAVTAFVIALIAVILSTLHLLNVSGGFGTGGGKAGAIVGVVLGIIGGVISLRALPGRSGR